MSQTSPEGRGGTISRWRSRSRGTKTMKAGYALAARDVKNWDRTVLERIGSAQMSPVRLQQLAQTAVNAEVRGGAFNGQSQRAGQAATQRMEATRAPQGRTANPIRRVARAVNRRRNVRRGTKSVKAAMVLAAKQAKNADRGVRQAMDPRGDARLNPTQLAALVEGRMDQVFRPEMYAQQQQAQQGPGRQQVQGQQGQGQQGPQQGARVQPAPSLMEQLQAGQQRQVELMAQMQQLQVEMQQLIQVRMQQINQEAANLAAMQGQMAQMNQQFGQQAGQPPAQLQQDDHVGQHAIIQTNEPAVTGEAAQPAEPAVTGEAAQPGGPAVDGEAAQPGEAAVDGETVQLPVQGDSEQAAAGQQAADGSDPELGGADGEQVEGGNPPVAVEPGAEAGDQQLGEGVPAPVAEGGPQQVEAGGPQLGDGANGAQPQVAAQQAVEGGRTNGQQVVQGGRANGQQVEGGDGPATGEQVSRAEAWVQAAEGQGAPDIQADPQGPDAREKAETAKAFAAGGNEVPPRPSTAAEAAETARSSRQDTTGAQRPGQTAGKGTQQPGPRT